MRKNDFTNSDTNSDKNSHQTRNTGEFLHLRDGIYGEPTTGNMLKWNPAYLSPNIKDKARISILSWSF